MKKLLTRKFVNYLAKNLIYLFAFLVCLSLLVFGLSFLTFTVFFFFGKAVATGFAIVIGILAAAIFVNMINFLEKERYS